MKKKVKEKNYINTQTLRLVRLVYNIYNIYRYVQYNMYLHNYLNKFITCRMNGNNHVRRVQG